MDASGRKAFWDTLCSLHTYDHESARKLIEVSPWPQELYRFRAVNENSLLQLQNNAFVGTVYESSFHKAQTPKRADRSTHSRL